MIDAELATEYVASLENCSIPKTKSTKLIHEAGDASVLRIGSIGIPTRSRRCSTCVRLDQWTNGKAIAAALKDWSDKRYAAHKKYGEVMIHAEPQEFLKIPKPDRLDRASIANWQAYFSASTNL